MSIIISAEVKTGNGAEFLFSPISYQLNSLALKRPVLLWMTEESAHPVLASATKRVEPGALSFPAERGTMPSWPTLRKQVLKRDNYTCQECNSTGGKLHAHHKHQRWQGGKDELENLITLCQSCHSELHAEEDRRYAEEMNRIGQAQYEAMRQCERDYMAQTGGIPQLDEEFGEFSKNWPGWADMPQYPQR